MNGKSEEGSDVHSDRTALAISIHNWCETDIQTLHWKAKDREQRTQRIINTHGYCEWMDGEVVLS